jgi:hypothetical protein
MKQLYKIITLFFVIFLIGMYFSVKSINEAFSKEDTKTEVVSIKYFSTKTFVKIF